MYIPLSSEQFCYWQLGSAMDLAWIVVSTHSEWSGRRTCCRHPIPCRNEGSIKYLPSSTLWLSSCRSKLAGNTYALCSWPCDRCLTLVWFTMPSHGNSLTVHFGLCLVWVCPYVCLLCYHRSLHLLSLPLLLSLPPFFRFFVFPVASLPSFPFVWPLGGLCCWCHIQLLCNLLVLVSVVPFCLSNQVSMPRLLLVGVAHTFQFSLC